MSGITHQQARRSQQAAMDGLLDDNRRALLDAHLKECLSCRAEAEEMKKLEAQLKHGFQERWNARISPSKNILENIKTKNRRFVLANRIHVSLNKLTSLVALLVLGLVINILILYLRRTPIASTAIKTPAVISAELSDRLMAFTSTQNGNSDIYIMPADGGAPVNITNNPAFDGNPVWSPDGQRIAFESDRDGNREIYLMNFDGNNLTRLTNDPSNDVIGISQSLYDKSDNAWSPDGSRLLFSNDRTGKWLHYEVSADGSEMKQLDQPDAPLGEVVWSPSGSQIAYSMGDMIIFVINADGTDRRQVWKNDSEAYDSDVSIIGWSQDERFLYYVYGNRGGTWRILRGVTDGAGTMQEVASGYPTNEGLIGVGLFAGGWLGSASNLFYVTEDPVSQSVYVFHNAQNGKSIALNPFSGCFRKSNFYQFNWAESKQGTEIVAVSSCSDTEHSSLYYLNLQTGTLRQVAQLPVVASREFDIKWTADGQYALIHAFNNSTKNTEIYTIKIGDIANPDLSVSKLALDYQIADLRLQPVSFGGLPFEIAPTITPTLQPVSAPPRLLWSGVSGGNLIAFISDATGNPDIYLANSDGSGIVNADAFATGNVDITNWM